MPTSNLALFAGAIIPPLFLMFFIYAKDPHEKEPIGLLIKIFFLGVLSCIPAALYESLGRDVIEAMGITAKRNPYLFNFLFCFLIVGFAEECVKYFATYISTWRNKNFNYRFDGIVYAVFASLGFATLENIMYVFQSGFETAIARALLSIPGHCNFGIFMGYFYGQAKYLEAVGDYKGCKAKRRTGLLVAILFHGIYDCCLFIYTTTRESFFIVIFFAFIIVLDILALVRVSKSSKEEFHRTLAPESNLVSSVMPSVVYGQNPQYQQYGQYNGYPQQQYQNSYGYQQNPNNPYAGQGYQQNPNYAYPQQGYTQNPNNPYAGTSYANAYQGQSQQMQSIYIYCNYCGSQCRRQSFYCTTCGKALYTR